MGKIELLSPAGNMECLRTAFQAGADAVYLGGQKFGARAYAGNFNDEELLEAIRLSAFWDKKIYLTVNTLMKQSEAEELCGWLSPFYEAGLHGIIVQDTGVLRICRKKFPQLSLHASTQMTVTEAGAALFLKEMGVSRIVPARELSLREIARLKKESGMELEVFIHGAMCYCYSGQCLFSSMLGGRSGNRGRCAQPCRQPYAIREYTADSRKSVNDRQTAQFPLSLKDMCTLPFFPELLSAGVDSLKIEGRMKSPEYVAGVTAVYRKYMDLYEKDPSGWHVDEKDMRLLEQFYIRTKVSGGYYKKHNGKDMITIDKPGYAPIPEDVAAEIRSNYLNKEMTRPVSLSIRLENGKESVLTAECEGVSVAGKGMRVSAAQNRPLTPEAVRKQLIKTGGSGFEAAGVEIFMQDDVFLPVSALNELRRQTLDRLADRISSRFARRRPAYDKEHEAARAGEASLLQNAHVREHSGFSGGKKQTPCLRVFALNARQAAAALTVSEVKRLYLPADELLFLDKAGDTGSAAQELAGLIRERKETDGGFTFYLSLPVILRDYSERYMHRLRECLMEPSFGSLVDGVQAGSLSGLVLLQKMGWEKGIALQHSVYIWNTESLDFYEDAFSIDTWTASLELNYRETGNLPADKQEMTVYGRIPMMISANCVKKTEGACKTVHTSESLCGGIWHKGMDYVLRDRYRTDFPVFINCRHCMNTIYNSVPLSLHTFLSEIKSRGLQGIRLDFTDESPDQVRRILTFFASGKGAPPAAYTTGHYKKGAQ